MLGGIIITKRSPKGHQRVTKGTGLGNTRIRRVPNEEGMLYIKEPDGTFAIYDERGILENHFEHLWQDTPISPALAGGAQVPAESSFEYLVSIQRIIPHGFPA